MHLRVVLLCLVAFAAHYVSSQSECIDLRGRRIAHGLHYVPGPETCTLCVCDNGLAKVCKAVLCSPPQDCRSFRMGNTCCEFICLDDVVRPVDHVSEANFRVAATAAGLVVILTIALIVYRVKRQKLMRPPLMTDDQRSLTSIGYISGSMGYVGGGAEGPAPGWKPPGHYLPRGEAPPPYDEAMAQSHHRMVAEEFQYPRQHPSLDSADQCGPNYANLSRPRQQQMANPQGCYATPLLQPMPPDNQPAITQHALAANILGLPRAFRLTGSLSAISGRGVSAPGLLPALNHSGHLTGFYAKSPALHRTIPRISTAGSAVDGIGSGRDRAGSAADAIGSARDRRAAVRRSFQREPSRDDILDLDQQDTPQRGCREHSLTPPLRTAPDIPQSRSATETPTPAAVHTNIPATRTMSDPHGAKPDFGAMCNANLGARCDANLGARCDANMGARCDANLGARFDANMGARCDANIGARFDANLGARCDANLGARCDARTIAGAKHDPYGVKATEPNGARTMPSLHGAKMNMEQAGTRSTAELAAPVPTVLPLTVDKPSCACSYSEPSAAGAEETDDYRSECENCKATSSSRWAVEEEQCWREQEEQTQTLQRRAPAAPPPPATATLPQRGPKPPQRPTMGPSNWDNWFSAIPDTDSESEGE